MQPLPGTAKVIFRKEEKAEMKKKRREMFPAV